MHVAGLTQATDDLVESLESLTVTNDDLRAGVAQAVLELGGVHQALTPTTAAPMQIVAQ